MEKLYIVYVHITPDGMHYYGVTNNHKHRWGSDGIHYRDTSLNTYIEKYGWDNIQHIVLFREQTKENALWIEDFLITTAQEDGVCINKQRSGLISKEEGYKQDYYEQNKQQMREQQKQYYEENKDKMKQYRERNKDKKRNYDKQYYEEHRYKILEQKRQYRQRKKLEKPLKEAVETPLF